MAIITTPNASPSSAYLPVRWVAQVNTPEAVIFARVAVTVNAVLVTTFDLSVTQFVLPDNYRFGIDIQSILQNLTVPISGQQPDSLGAMDAAYFATSPDAFGTASISVSYFFRNSTTGLIEDLGVTDTSANVRYLAAALQKEEGTNFGAFILSAGSNNRFLTSAPPNSQNITLLDNQYLSFLDSGAATLEVTTYDASGAQIDIGRVGTGATGGANALDVRTIGVGPRNLRFVIWLVGNVDINNPNVSYYTVQVGQGPLVFAPFSELLRFNIIPQCDETDLRIHFLNRYGVMDAYTFTGSRELVERSSNDIAQSDTYNILDPNPPLVRDISNFKINSKAQRVYNVTTKLLDVGQANLLKEAVTSPIVYIEKFDELGNRNLFAAYIESQSLVFDKSNERVQFELTIIESNDVFIQRV